MSRSTVSLRLSGGVRAEYRSGVGHSSRFLGRFLPRHVFAALAVLAVGQGAACTCSKGQDASAVDAAAASAPAEIKDAAPAALELPRLSLPMGASLLPSGAVVVAGLSVAEKAVRVALVGVDGRVAATTAIFGNAEWAHDSEVSVHSVGNDVVVSFRGKVEGGLRRSIVRLDERLVAKEPVTFGAVTCATKDGVFWLDKKHVKAETPSGRKDFPVPTMDGDLGLFCDESHALVTADAEGALSTSEIMEGGFGPVVPLVGDKDFSDEEREHAFFVGASGLGVLRIGSEGAIAVKLASHGPRKIPTKLEEDDDLVVADADDAALYVASTQDHDGCETGEDASALPTLRTSRFSTSVHLLRIDLATDKAIREDLGRAACGHQAGPFFFGKAREKRILAWSERAPGANKTKPPIAAFSYRVLGPNTAGTVSKRVPLRADGLVDAGCNATSCAVVWLERPEGQDDKQPELPRILRFPE